MRCLGTATARSSCNRKEGNPPLAEAIIKKRFEAGMTWICRNCGNRRNFNVTFNQTPAQSYRSPLPQPFWHADLAAFQSLEKDIVGFEPTFDRAGIKPFGGIDNQSVHLFFLQDRIERIG